MASFFSFLIQKRIPSYRTLCELLRGPLTFHRTLAYICLLAIAVVTFITLITFNNSFLTTVPARGGTLVEGVIGAPKAINPVLASTDTDRAFTSLVYAGLMKFSSDGTVTPELAQDYTVSPDGRIYTFTLNEATFHDGKPLTSRDVAFTVEALQKANLNPSQAAYWQDIGTETPDERTIIFALPAPRADFLERATVGILPEHIWKDIPDETFSTAKQNIHAVGAGAFEIASVKKENGVVTRIALRRNNSYIQGAPLLKKLILRITSNQSELGNMVRTAGIDITSQLLPSTIATLALPSKTTVIQTPTETTAVLYHARGESGALANTALTSVLSDFIDKEKIIAIVENGYGEVLNASTTPLDTVEEAQQKLATLGYRLNNGTLYRGTTPVGISIATTNDPQLVTLATTLATELRSLGITVSLRSFDQGFFQTELERTTFNAVLVKGIEPPARYESVLPLYKTTVPFVVKTNAHGIIPSVLISPVLRYANVNEWYTNTDKLYSWFVHQKSTTNN